MGTVPGRLMSRSLRLQGEEEEVIPGLGEGVSQAPACPLPLPWQLGPTSLEVLAGKTGG